MLLQIKNFPHIPKNIKTKGFSPNSPPTQRKLQLYPSILTLYVHVSEVCHLLYFLKCQCTYNPGTAGPHARILPLPSSSQPSSRQRRLPFRTHGPPSHSWLKLQALVRASRMRFWFLKGAELPIWAHCSKGQHHQGHFLIHQSSWEILNPKAKKGS